MTKTENEIIAEFMGIVFWKQINGQKYYKVPKEHVYVNNANLGQFRYDKSWDWLMPVVEKIEALDFHTDIGNGYCNITSSASGWAMNSFEVISITDKSKINAAYIAVVEFIKWYNTQNSNPTSS